MSKTKLTKTVGFWRHKCAERNQSQTSNKIVGQKFRLVHFIWTIDNSTQSEKEIEKERQREIKQGHTKNPIEYVSPKRVHSFYFSTLDCCCCYFERKSNVLFLLDRAKMRKRDTMKKQWKRKNLFNFFVRSKIELYALMIHDYMTAQKQNGLSFNCISTNFVFDCCYRETV